MAMQRAVVVPFAPFGPRTETPTEEPRVTEGSAIVAKSRKMLQADQAEVTEDLSAYVEDEETTAPSVPPPFPATKSQPVVVARPKVQDAPIDFDRVLASVSAPPFDASAIGAPDDVVLAYMNRRRERSRMLALCVSCAVAGAIAGGAFLMLLQ